MAAALRQQLYRLELMQYLLHYLLRTRIHAPAIKTLLVLREALPQVLITHGISDLPILFQEVVPARIY